jgi:8-oxo-dGTP pyrophosphatase MutT (NUDIX family)
VARLLTDSSSGARSQTDVPGGSRLARQPIPTWYFAVVLVRLSDRFLLVQESKHGQLWYLPAGRVEAGEDLVQAARRETLEEAGIPIIVEGILRVEHSPLTDGSARLRVVFAARPADDTKPKSEPDEESLQAAWVSLAELSEYPLRGNEVRMLCEYAAGGGPVYPLSLLQREGLPYQV